MAGEEDLTVVLNLRISPEDAARLDAFGITKSHVARICMRLGLEKVEADPTILLAKKEMKPGPKAKKPPE